MFRSFDPDDTFDPVSRLANNLSGTINDLSETFAYNPASQITSTVRTGDTYAWTAHGNGSTAFTQNGLNQQITIGGSAATWDSKGNLTSEPQSGKTYGYSSENLLTSATGGVTLGYDPALRLYQVAGAATTRFAYDGSNAIAEYNGSNALQRRYVFGPGADEALVQYEGTGTTDRRFMSADERGSIISLTDSSGALLNIDRYDEYGKPQSTNVGRFQYTGQMWLSELGTYYYKARVYLPQLGIFAQTDPIRQAGGPNLYAYVFDDPVNLSDPFGLTPPVPPITPPEPPIIVNGWWSAADLWGTTSLAPHVGEIGAVLAFASIGIESGEMTDDDEETPTCKRINDAGNQAKSQVPSYVKTDPAHWEDSKYLRGELANTLLNLDDAQNLAWLFGGWPSRAADVGLGGIAKADVETIAELGKSAAGRAAGAVGIGLQVYGTWAGRRANVYQKQANAIQARLDQLEAQQDGTCPKE